MSKASIIIVGLGVSGLGCAAELVRRGIPFSAYEQENGPGGLARTDVVDGFRFDYGPHILLDLPEDIAEWFGGLPGLDLALCSGPSGIAMDAGLGGCTTTMASSKRWPCNPPRQYRTLSRNFPPAW